MTLTLYCKTNADRYTLNQGRDSWQLMEKLYQGDDREKFFREIEQFLQQTGYANDNGKKMARRSPKLN